MTIDVRIKPDGTFLPNRFDKDPEDVIDVVIDYSQYFKLDDITSITVVGTNITIDSSAEADNIVTIFISAGNNGTNAKIKLTVNSATRTLERTLFVKVRNL